MWQTEQSHNSAEDENSDQVNNHNIVRGLAELLGRIVQSPIKLYGRLASLLILFDHLRFFEY